MTRDFFVAVTFELRPEGGARASHVFSAKRNSCAKSLSKKWFIGLRNRKVAGVAGG